MRKSWWILLVMMMVGACTHAHPSESVPTPEALPDCHHDKCVALTFDDGPGPYTDRLLHILTDNHAQATFFLIGNKVADHPDIARHLAQAGMEIGSHTWEHPNMTTIPTDRIAEQFFRANQAITQATGHPPHLWRPAGGLTNSTVNEYAARYGLAGILWDVIPFDWINDSNLEATKAVLMSQIQPGSVVLFHDTYSSTVDLIYQFIPVLQANGYHLVTVSQLLGPRIPGSVYGRRENGPPVNLLHDISICDIPTLPATPSPPPAPNYPITDIEGANSGGPNDGQ